MKEIKLDKIKSKVFERSEIDEEKMAELVKSIENIGVVQPILVRPKGDGYEVVVGGRRFKGSKNSGTKKIPAVIRDLSDKEALESILVENIHRERMSNLDKGKLCKILLKEFSDEYPSQRALGEKLGVARRTISNWINLTRLPEEAQRKISSVPASEKAPKGKISSRTGVEISSKIKNKKREAETANALAKRSLGEKTTKKVIQRSAEETDKPVNTIIEEETKVEPELIFWEEFREPIVDGRKTVTVRPTYPRVKEGDRAWAHFTDPKPFKLKIESIERKELGDLSDEDLEGEDVESLDEYREIWERIHDWWDPKKKVYVVKFTKLDS